LSLVLHQRTREYYTSDAINIDHHEVETDLEVEEGISYGFQEKYPIQIRLDNQHGSRRNG
jgi:hypothetical protein